MEKDRWTEDRKGTEGEKAGLGVGERERGQRE